MVNRYSFTVLQLCVCRGRFVGDFSDGGTPGPFSNPAVKSVSADGSMWFLHASVGHCQRYLPLSLYFCTLIVIIGRLLLSEMSAFFYYLTFLRIPQPLFG